MSTRKRWLFIDRYSWWNSLSPKQQLLRLKIKELKAMIKSIKRMIYLSDNWLDRYDLRQIAKAKKAELTVCKSKLEFSPDTHPEKTAGTAGFCDCGWYCQKVYNYCPRCGKRLRWRRKDV